jgi:hypothetical protein
VIEEHEQHLFIVRVWREPSSRDDAWRGSAKHVSSGQIIVSADLNELTDFIRVRLASEPSPSAGGETVAT